MKIQAGILVASDRVSAGERRDRSGPAAREALEHEAKIVELLVVPDDYAEIRRSLLRMCGAGLDVIFTLGGTGLSPRDVTPEATRSVIDREVPGISRALLWHGLSSTPHAMLSRAVAGVRGKTLIINLPGNPGAVTESIEFLLDALPHAIEVMHGKGRHRHQE